MTPPSFIVTGGAGFIGANVVAELNRRGHEDVIIVDHLNHPEKEKNLARVKYADYIDKTEFRLRLKSGGIPKVKGVFHLGACSSTTEKNEFYLFENNFLYTRELCKWTLENDVRFVYASSAATYGDGSKGYSDDHAVTKGYEPLNLYGKSKQLFDVWALQNNVLDSIAGVKYFNVYGKWEDHKGEMRSLVNKAYAQVKEEGVIRLFKSYKPEYEDGKQERDFVFIDDAVAMTLWLYDHPEVNGLYNCGTGKARNWIDLANALFLALFRQPEIEFIDMPEDIRDKYQYHTEADMSKLRKAGYTNEPTSIEEGVRRYVQEYLIRGEG